MFCTVSTSLQGPACAAQVAHEELRRRAGAAEAECARLGRQLRQQGGLVDAAEAELAALQNAVGAAAQQGRQLQEALSGYHRRTHDAAARQEKLLGACPCITERSQIGRFEGLNGGLVCTLKHDGRSHSKAELGRQHTTVCRACQAFT